MAASVKIRVCIKSWMLVLTFAIESTLASGIDIIRQGINIGPGKFGKRNKRNALNTHVLCSK